ncbi:DUF3558 family protein [Virgisporangium aliadipatigenens]|nr:DUF3558 family protein [Virgisporangium aliadipatigenens]
MRWFAFGFALSLLAGGCAGGPDPRTPPSAQSTPAPSASPAAPQPRRYPRAELAAQPCLALDDRDLAALGIGAAGTEESGPTCTWKLAGQNVSLDLDVELSFAEQMTAGGRVTQVSVGRHNGVQAEFQRICFTFVALDAVDDLVGATTIPEPGAPQEGACPAGAAVLAAALTHVE